MGQVKIKRKLFRLVGLLFPALYVTGDRVRAGAGLAAAAGVLVLFLLIMVTLEYIRFRRPGVNRWLFDHFGSYTKEKERSRTSSTTYYLLSCLVTILLFPKWIAIPAMILLVVSDPVAEIVGTRWGRTPLMGKSLEGTLGGLAAGLAVTLPLGLVPAAPPVPVLVAGALAASVLELLPLQVDDNFVIALGAGAAMTALVWLTG